MGLGMRQAPGNTKWAGSRIDWAEGTGGHQDKMWDPVESWWCSVSCPRGRSRLPGHWGNALRWHGAAQCQRGPAVWAVELGMRLQAPASTRRLGVLGWTGGGIPAGAVVVLVVERPGGVMGRETRGDAAKCSAALVSPALQWCWALLPHFYSIWHVRARCEGVAVVPQPQPASRRVSLAMLPSKPSAHLRAAG